MKTPVKIVRDVLKRHGAASLISAELDADIVKAIEAAGYVIAHPDQVTEGMARSFVVAQTLDKPWNQLLPDQISAALRAAPQWTKG